MSEITNQTQFELVNKKLDLLLEELSDQRKKQAEMEDLIADMQLVIKEVFQTTVTNLDQEEVELNGKNLTRLGINIVKNIDTFNELFKTIESLNDFSKDVIPIVQQVGFQITHKMEEIEQKGYFEYAKQLSSLFKNLSAICSAEDIAQLNKNLPHIINITKLGASESNLKALENMLKILKQLKLDNSVDNKSFYQLYKEFKSPEIRKSLSFGLRLVREVVKEK